MTSKSEVHEAYELLLTNYQNEKVLYQKLLDLAESQVRALSEDQRDVAIGIIQEKGAVIAELQRMEDSIAEPREKWQQFQESFPVEKREVLAHLIEEIREMIQKIIEKDEESEIILRHWTEQSAQAIQQARQSAQAAQAYEKQKLGDSPSILIDRKE